MKKGGDFALALKGNQSGILTRLALNLLRINPLPRSIRRRIKLAGWNEELLRAVIAQVR